jgi:hypothetical protein
MKRGVNYYIIGIIMLSLFLLISIPIMNSFKDKSEDTLSHNLCADSVKVNSAFTLGEGDFRDRIKCPTVFEVRPERSQEAAMKLLSNRMVMAWQEFQRGKPVMFDRNLLDSTNYCIFRFVEEFKYPNDIGQIDLAQFTQFMNAERTVYEGKDMPVLEFLSDYSTYDLGDVDTTKLQGTKIDTSVPQAIVIWYSKESEPNVIFAVATGIGATVGLVAATVLSGGTVLIAAATVAGAAGFGGLAIWTEVGVKADHYATIMLVPWTTESLAQLNCEHLPAEQKVTDT